MSFLATNVQARSTFKIVSDKLTIIPVGAGSPTIFANNRQSQKPAPADRSQSVDRTRYNWEVEKTGIARQNYANMSAIALQQRQGSEWEKLARERYAAGEFEEAAKYWQQAAAAFEIKGDWLNQAIALSNLSLTYQQFGRWQEAENAIEKSLSLLPPDSGENSPAELRAIAQILDIKGNGQLERGQANNALKTWQQSASIYVKLKDEFGWQRSLISQVKAMQGLGLYDRACQALMPVILSENRGRFAIPDRTCAQLTNRESLDELQKVLQTQFNSNSKSIQLTGGRLLGDVLRQLGFLDNSEKLLKAVDRAITQDKNPQETALVWLSLGNTYEALGNRNRFLSESEDNAIKNYSTALDYYRKAADAAGKSPIKFQAQLNLFSLLVDAKNGNNVNLREAEELRLAILSQLNQLPPSRHKIYAEIGLMKGLANLKNQELKAENNQPNLRDDKAESLSNYCLPDSPTVSESLSQNTRSLSWGEIVNQGAKAVKLGRDLGDLRATAYALGNLGEIYEQKNQWLEAQQCTEQALLLSQNVQLNSPDLAYQWQWQLGRIRWHKEEKDIQGAIAAYTAAFNTLQSIRNDLVPISRDGQFDFRDRIEPVYRDLVDLLLQEPEPKPDNLIQARNVIEALQVAELDNFFRDACVQIKTKQIDGIDRTAAVIYPIILEDRLEVIVSLPNQLLHHRSPDAPRKKVEDLAKKLQDELSEAGARAEVPKLSKFFYEWLIEPFNKYLKQYPDLKTLVFVLDASLRNIPMGVLYDGDEVTQKGNYLIENYAIALAPGLQLISPNFWRAERLKVLIAGLSKERQFPGRTPFPALKYVEQELGNIQKEVPSREKPLINQDFLKNSLKNQINSLRSSVVHIATHGEFSSEPEQTFIVAYDDVIQSKELSDILSGRRASEGNSIELLVLSACKTAKGDPRAALGLAGVAVRSGARSTLATLWYVDDESTAELMVQFYNELKKPNVSKAEALRQAQLSLLAKQSDSYYWAPFVMIGNWL
ncbi:CHAT domain-containing protein [Microcoleus sp. K5-D4]|uniref:CHAT domain-containing protein n=1 Tax=Microcoleus sp. K5-D4 TaxID=2818801 RepID=UPI002FD4249D